MDTKQKINELRQEIKSLAFEIDRNKFEGKEIFQNLIEAHANLELALFYAEYQEKKQGGKY